MKRALLNLSVGAALFATSALLADDAEQLIGKWSVKKTNDQGQPFTQMIEVKKDNKFVFQILGGENQVMLHAEGDVKFEKLGPFDSIRFYHIRGGLSATELQDVDEERAGIYVLDGDTLTMATNFERERRQSGQKPTADMYQRVKGSAQGSGSSAGGMVIDEVEMADTPQAATWYYCFEATVEGATRRYYVENKGYDKNKLTIPMALEVPRAQAGQKCSFKMQLDDIDGDACSDEPDNRTTGSFTISDKGSQSYKPEDNWRFTIRWHLK